MPMVPTWYPRAPAPRVYVTNINNVAAAPTMAPGARLPLPLPLPLLLPIPATLALLEKDADEAAQMAL